MISMVVIYPEDLSDTVSSARHTEFRYDLSDIPDPALTVRLLLSLAEACLKVSDFVGAMALYGAIIPSKSNEEIIYKGYVGTLTALFNANCDNMSKGDLEMLLDVVHKLSNLGRNKNLRNKNDCRSLERWIKDLMARKSDDKITQIAADLLEIEKHILPGKHALRGNETTQEKGDIPPGVPRTAKHPIPPDWRPSDFARFVNDEYEEDQKRPPLERLYKNPSDAARKLFVKYEFPRTWEWTWERCRDLMKHV
jgi:hypothetical protein